MTPRLSSPTAGFVEIVVEGLPDLIDLLLLVRGRLGRRRALRHLVELARVEPDELVLAADVERDLRRIVAADGDGDVDHRL